MKLIDTRRAAVLATAAFAAAAIAGCGSSSTTTTTDHASGSMAGDGMSTTTTTHAGHATADGTMQGMTPLVPGADGTSATAAGLTLRPATTTMVAGKDGTLAFKVVDAKGMAVTRFERDQTKLLHLIVVREDLTGYQHIHPTLGSGGRFTVPLRLAAPGRYHAIADFTTGGKRYALSTVLRVPGSMNAVALPAPGTTAVTDGYTVSFKHGTLATGREAQLTFTVSEGGSPVTELRPYLGASGHLVALRRPTLAYSHVHPAAADVKRGSITFAADFAAPGTYRLFLQFRTGGKVHTTPFTLTVGA